MAGGPILPHSAYPVTAGNVFPNIHVGGGANSKHDAGLGVDASIASDSIWRLRFLMPPTGLPSGTCKLRLLALANATSGSAKVNPKCADVAAGSSPSGATLTAEGTNTLTWAAGDNDKYKELKITLSGTVPIAGDMLVVDLTFETSGWTLAAVSTWIASIIWE
jgi:hypothetical protein